MKVPVDGKQGKRCSKVTGVAVRAVGLGGGL
jgi:hypothetical protein